MSPLDIMGRGGLALLLLLLASCSRGGAWHATDVSGSLPALQFRMTRANDGKTVTQQDYRGKVTLLFFGYTYCPDVCPMTLSNMVHVLRGMGPAANGIRVLFVTVDPARDTVPVLRRYVTAFGPRIDALRGTPDALAALARRYRVAWSVRPGTGPDSYEVSHSSSIFAFGRDGAAHLLISTLATSQPDFAGVADDLRRLTEARG
jgi:protein SCO1/2